MRGTLLKLFHKFRIDRSIRNRWGYLYQNTYLHIHTHYFDSKVICGSRLSYKKGTKGIVHRKGINTNSVNNSIKRFQSIPQYRSREDHIPSSLLYHHNKLCNYLVLWSNLDTYSHRYHIHCLRAQSSLLNTHSLDPQKSYLFLFLILCSLYNWILQFHRLHIQFRMLGIDLPVYKNRPHILCKHLYLSNLTNTNMEDLESNLLYLILLYKINN